MSCQRPLHINHRAVYWREGIDPTKLLVNCGRCESCLKQITDGYLVRSFFEMRDCVGYDFNGDSIGSHGFSIFATQTYKRSMRPKKEVQVGNEKFIIEGFSCKHIQRFNSTLQDRYHDVYPDAPKEEGIRYIVCSEYGYDTPYVDAHGRNRIGENAPHYHSVYFFPARANQEVTIHRPGHEDVKVDGQTYWAHYLKTLWAKNGMLEYSKKYGPFLQTQNIKTNKEKVNPLVAIKYVVAYACKQHDYFRIPAVAKYLLQDIPEDFSLLTQYEFSHLDRDQKEKYIELKNKYSDCIKQRSAEIKDILPNHWQSKGFGASCAKWLASLPQDQRLAFIQDGISFPGDEKKDKTLNVYQIPKYIIDKLYTHYFKDKIFNYKTNRYNTIVTGSCANDLMLEDKRLLYAKSLSDGIYHLKKSISFLSLQKFKPLEIQHLTKGKFNNARQLYTFFDDVTKDFSPRYICNYKTLRYLGYIPNLTPYFDAHLRNMSDDDFDEYVYSFYFRKLAECKDRPLKPGLEPWLKKKNHKDRYRPFEIPVLEEMLYYLQRIDAHNSHIRYLDSARTKKQKQELKYLGHVVTQ